MPTATEKIEFSKRLELALRRSSEPVQGATDLALQFNLRYSGESISTQTAHKWLSGRTIPMHDKLAVLANWLDVDKHWLHYGSPRSKTSSSQGKDSVQRAPSQKAIELAERIQSLPPQWQYFVEDLVGKLKEELS